ncbi:hypothetical protein VC83_05497 [Pseudogymnoascus destructans]|nr:uncharacterized protein VC83_05497 [Pseudogymnoascus destructans]OAF57839.1 hypothetical protein VC83_05497 [Pseudogymnoascus destructans]
MDEIISLPQLDPWSDTVSIDSSLQFEDERYREERLVTEEEEEEEKIETTTVISSDVSDKATRVMKVNYTTDLPEYPETSENGVAYIINTSSMTPEAVDAMCNNVQYCHKRLQPPKPTHCSVLNNAYCKRMTYICTGITHCEYLHPQLQEMHHTKLCDDDWKKIIQLRANSFVLSIFHLFMSRRACQNQEDSCSFQLVASENVTISNMHQYSIQCPHSTPANYHFFRPIPATLYSELPFIQERLNGTITASDELCAVIEQNSTRRKHCGVEHIQGRGKLIHTNCNVQFRLFQPYNLIDCPYIIWTSHGVHCHPPPPPSRTPQQLVDSLLTVIKKINDPSLTTRTLLKNPALQSFYEHWNGKSLSDVHKSLINLDKISFILRKQQLLNYPYGQHLIGVQHEWDVSHKNKPNSYIKNLILNEEKFMAVCFYTEAAKVLLKRDSFEIDMTFKRIKASEINEVVFAAFLPELNKVVTFVRIFVNQESTEMYTQLFHTVFNAIAKETGQRIQWKHLHQSGFGAVVMDMDSKQMSGLGRYLSDIDDHHRPWQWHVQHVIIYCTIHFKRGILKAVGTAFSGNFLRQQMEQLLYVSTREEYFELCNLIISDKQSTEQIRFWAIHKKQLCIASGLNASCSLMDNELFFQIRRHTNAVEKTHWKSTSLGKQLSILKAIQMGQILDETDLKQYLGKVTHGVNHSWRSSSLSSRYALQESRHRRKRQRHETDYNDGISVISSASSSGSRSQSRSRPRSQRGGTLRRVASITSASQAQEISIEQSRLELQAETARVRRMELENEKLELELINLREAARGRADL